MTAKILFNSPTPELSALCREIAASLKLDVEVIEGVFEQAAKFAHDATRKNPSIEVVISRDATARVIEQAVDLPVVHLAPTDTDYFYAIRQARQHGRRIGVLLYQREARDFEVAWFTELLNCSVQVFPYNDHSQFQAQVAWAQASGIRVLVMRSAYGAEIADQAGMLGIVVHTGRKAVVQALERATAVTRARQQEREKGQLFQTILDHVYDGVLAVNRQGLISLCNAVAARMLGIQQGATVDGASSVLSRLLEDYSPRRGYMLEVGDKRIIANRASIEIGKETVGTAVTFQDITKVQRMEEQIRKELYTQGLVAKYTLDSIIGSSRSMHSVLTKAREIASFEGTTVLIVGESGTGKELLAQGIHSLSPVRNRGPFVAINCAALPQSLLESELFGYESGAFTGARKGGKPGLFELAHGGTIFLDEIGKVSLDLQARLLRVLQERQVMRIGGDRVLPVDIRVIAASNENLLQAIQDNTFRADLYYRLNILRLTVPSLRERKDDIPLLVEHFLRRAQKKYGTAKRPSERLMTWFLDYHWPGNVRELDNILERYTIWSRFMDDDAFLAELESEVGSAPAPASGGEKLSIDLGSMDAMERQILEQAIDRVGGNRTYLARVLGISRTTLWNKLKYIHVSEEAEKEFPNASDLERT